MDLSIVVPTLGRERSLQKLLEALTRSQRYYSLSFEILVICNPDLESIAEMVGRFRYQGWPVRYIGSQNVGTNKARHLGAGYAQGKMILFLDDDTCPLDSLFLQRLDQVKALHGENLVGGGYYLSRPKSSVSTLIYNMAANLWLARSQGFSGRVPCLLGGCTLVSSHLYSISGGFNLNTQGAGEEHLLCESLFSFGWRPLLIPELSVFHDFQGGMKRLLTNAFQHGRAQRHLGCSPHIPLQPKSLGLASFFRIMGQSLNLQSRNGENWRICLIITGLFPYFLMLRLGCCWEWCLSFKEQWVSALNAIFYSETGN